MLKKPTLKKSWLLSSQFQSNIVLDTQFAPVLKSTEEQVGMWDLELFLVYRETEWLVKEVKSETTFIIYQK